MLYRVLRDHLATFLEDAAQLDDGACGVPRFVQKELHAFLSCGVLARGLIRLHCSDCGKRIVQIGADPNATWIEVEHPHHGHYERFDLHADVAIAAADRQGLEHVLRYGARPAVAAERLSTTADGRVALELRRPYHDGTTHLLFEPLAFIERLAALVPRPHKNLIIYSGVLAPNAELRSQAVAYGAAEAPEPDEAPRTNTSPPAAGSTTPRARRANYGWADLMRRSFGLDVLHCPHCGGRLKLLAAVFSPSAIRAILESLGLPTDPPEPRPARAPPECFGHA